MTNNLDFIIKEAKIKFGEIYLVEVESETYIFRLLTRKDYKEALEIADNKDMAEEIICQMAVIYPTGLNFANGDAGLPSLIAPHIVNESGFGDMSKSHHYFDMYRNRMQSFELQAEAAIQAAFPQFTEEDMQEWTVERLMRTLAKAEWILKNVKGYPIEFRNQAEEEAGEGEEVPEEEGPTMKELGNELRQQGRDPMVDLAEHIIKPKPYAEFPFIAGTNYWKQVY